MVVDASRVHLPAVPKSEKSLCQSQTEPVRVHLAGEADPQTFCCTIGSSSYTDLKNRSNDIFCRSRDLRMRSKMLEALLGSVNKERVLFFIYARGEGYAREIARFFFHRSCAGAEAA